MRTIFVILLVSPAAFLLLDFLMLDVTYRLFRMKVATYRTAEDMARLRRLAKFQMYNAVFTPPLVIIALPFVIWLVGWLGFRALYWWDIFALGILPFAVPIAVAVIWGSPADRCREIPAATDELAAERDHIVKVWIEDDYPDW